MNNLYYQMSAPLYRLLEQTGELAMADETYEQHLLNSTNNDVDSTFVSEPPEKESSSQLRVSLLETEAREVRHQQLAWAKSLDSHMKQIHDKLDRQSNETVKTLLLLVLLFSISTYD